MQLRRADQQNEPIAIEPVAAVQATETTPWGIWHEEAVGPRHHLLVCQQSSGG
jgi:hypothetical protein